MSAGNLKSKIEAVGDITARLTAEYAEVAEILIKEECCYYIFPKYRFKKYFIPFYLSQRSQRTLRL